MKKKGLILIVILLLYCLFMIFMFSNKKEEENIDNNEPEIIENDEYSKYIIIGPSTNILYKNNKWTKASNHTIENAKNHFKIYDDNNYLGEYTLKYGKAWNIFNDKNEYIDYKGNLFAYSNNMNLKLIRFNNTMITNDDEKIIKEQYGNKSFDDLITNQVINIDIDSDNEIDKIICLSNNGEEINDSKNYYNLVFVHMNNNYYTIIDQNNNNSKTLELPTYEINRIFNLDNSIYIVIMESYGIDTDSPVINNHLYKFDNDKFIELFHD